MNAQFAEEEEEELEERFPSKTVGFHFDDRDVYQRFRVKLVMEKETVKGKITKWINDYVNGKLD